MDASRCEGENVRRQIEADARDDARQMIERAKREITNARDDALEELYNRASHLVMEMARSVLKRQLTPEDHEKLIRQALRDLRKEPGSQN